MRGQFFDRRDARTCRRQRQQGSVIILFAVCLLAMVGILGLAIDSSIAYLSKARLSLAADSAVLAAADSYTSDTNKGVDRVTRDSNASAVAKSYFHLNYPDWFLHGEKPKGVLAFADSQGATALEFDANSENPLTFATVLSSQRLTPKTSPVVELRHMASNTNVAMLLDQSTSVTKGSWDEIADILRKHYVAQLDQKTTRISVIPFGSPEGTKVAVKFDKNKDGFNPAAVSEALNGYLGGATSLCKALHLAVEQFDSLAGTVPRQNVILLITDGQPSDGQEDYCYDPVTKVRGIDNYFRENIHKKGIAVYSIGWGPEFGGDGPGSAANYLKCYTGDRQYPGQSCDVDVGLYDDSKYCLGDIKADSEDQGYPYLTSCITHSTGGAALKVLTR
ncbi:TadE/TadG family type IV pilus assembly protein [Burkholderia ubonensis]|uniref:TadE/TadG family type IV pilus assembly protein n=1 Tax=Burkholderia ubonensis TaxID=101571 RepID=UPI0009B39A0D|nr:vWA domain-containing protein [Burkholderia ubonensis]